jgi:hypothetical protein
MPVTPTTSQAAIVRRPHTSDDDNAGIRADRARWGGAARSVGIQPVQSKSMARRNTGASNDMGAMLLYASITQQRWSLFSLIVSS